MKPLKQSKSKQKNSFRCAFVHSNRHNGCTTYFKCLGPSKDAAFVGQWAAPILIVGVYNKLVEQEESK